MRKFTDKLTQHPWLVLLLLAKEVYDIILEVASWKWNKLSLDLSNFTVFMDFAVMAVVVGIIMTLLHRIKEQRNNFETRKKISKVVDLTRAELNYLRGATFPNPDKKKSFFERHLKEEQILVEERLPAEFPNLSQIEIQDLMFDFYGYSFYEES